MDEIGWIPVDPADVRKVMLEEQPNGQLTDPHVERARMQLFGSWEMNWVAFNDAHDVQLPGWSGKPLPFLMYPEAEIAACGAIASTRRDFAIRSIPAKWSDRCG